MIAVLRWPRHAVGEVAAEDRREIRKSGVEAEDLRGERLHVERPEQAFQRRLHGAIAEHGFDLPGQQQVFHHVENEQRGHPEIGKALPHLGREQHRKALRMAEQVRVLVVGGSGRVAWCMRAGCGFSGAYYRL